MTLHDPNLPRKRLSRFWLYAPYVVVLIAAIGWSLVWLWLRAEIAHRMDATATRLREAGYTVDWTARRIDGYPFRIDVTLEQTRLAEPSGWALAAAEIRAEAYAYEPGHWIGYAPQGVVLTRPASGAVAITGPALRASYTRSDRGAPRIAVEGLKLVFTALAGAKPFAISRAEHLDFHLRPVEDDGAEFLLRIDGASAPPEAILARIAQDRPMDLSWEAKLSKVSALRGRDWPSAVRTWTAAGGDLEVARGGLTAGPAMVALRQGRLTVGSDGRLRGAVGLDLRQAPSVIRILADAKAIDPAAADAAAMVAQARAGGGMVTQADLTFLAGVTTFGPVAIGPAPKVY
jgi:hypothetical protein